MRRERGRSGPLDRSAPTSTRSCDRQTASCCWAGRVSRSSLTGAVATVVPHLGAVGDRPRLAWWGFAVAFAITEALAFNLEVKGQAQGFTLNYVPLVVGLFYVSPLGLIGAYLLGGAVTLVRARPSTRVQARAQPRDLGDGGDGRDRRVPAAARRLDDRRAPILARRGRRRGRRRWRSGVRRGAAIAVAFSWYGSHPQIGLTLVVGAR